MYAKHKSIKTLDEDISNLKSSGWYFVTFFQAKGSINSSFAYQKATEKALILEQQVGIRTVVDNDMAYYEVWSRK